MASIYQQKRSPYWYLKFKGLGARIERCSSGILASDATHDHALSVARDIEDACRVLRAFRSHSIGEIERATNYLVSVKYLAPKQADAWLSDPRSAGETADAERDQRIVGIMEAALAHPSAMREKVRDGASFMRHQRELREFMDWARVTRLRDLSRELVLRYVQHMKAEGRAWDSRRHRLLWLRYACAMAPENGIADPIARFRIDERRGDAERTETESLTEEQLGALLRALVTRGDTHWLVVVGLMACCGLRGSEVLRLEVGDIDGDVVRVGRRDRKTASSRRDLPMPATVAGWVRAACADQPADAPLVRTGKSRGRAPNRYNLARDLGKRIGTDAGIDVPVKTLRKTFATLATWNWNLDSRHIDSYLGRRIEGYSTTTAAHYLAKAQRKLLAPVAAQIDMEIRRILG